ncbi:MAG: mechanosensitive ion channel family protein [Nitrococcus mobilis]|nr:mechanosensitive ion channel family protein [Nitrococcus mobilis]
MFALLLALLGIGNALGEEAQKVPFEQLLKGWNQTLERAKEALESDFARAEMAEIKADLRATLDSARKARDQATTRLETAKERLASLTPAPDSKESEEESGSAEAAATPQETPQVAALRKEAQSQVVQFRSQVTQATLVIDQANNLLESIAGWEQLRFRSQILKRSPSPFQLQIWPQAAADALTFAGKAIEAPRAWWDTYRAEDSKQRLLIPLLAVLVLGLGIGWPIRIWLARRFGRDGTEPEPTYARRIVAALADGVANAIIPAAIIVLTLLVLYRQGVLTGLFAALFHTGGAALAAYLMIMGLARAAASPHLVAWRIAPVQPAHVYRLLMAVRGVTASLLIAFALLLTAYYYKMLTPELESAFFAIQVTLTSLLMIWALAPAYWETSLADSQSAGSVEQAAERMEAPSITAEEAETTASAEEISPRSWFERGRKAVRVIMLLTPFLALAGYGRLAFFIQSRLALAAILFGFALLLRLAIGEMVERWLTRRRLMPNGAVQKTADTDQHRIRGITFWIGMVVSLLIFLPLIYLFLLICGVPSTTLQLWIGQLLSGIQLGGISISLGALLLAILVLIVGVIITNIFRHWLANRVLPNTRLDSGARNSIAAATGYLGVGIVMLLAISTLGVDFSNLALVAGALGVGIGFGLQNVVQNFVAGLLMLIERPVKVGDWIVVGATEGTVKRIAVRSTEIETFDRSSVIVPNSEFVSSPVTNWTYKNRLARIIVPVGVAYGSDTKKVAAILLRCAQAHRHVLRYPPAAAYFLAFGESSLNFELRCYVYDTDYYLSTLSDLHFAVDEAFRQEGIEIPFPQRDLHLHSDRIALSPRQQEAEKPTGKQARQ